MKKLILLILIAWPLIAADNPNNKVYICTGKYSKAYHKNTKCKGMKACKGDIKTITLQEAQNIGRTPCGFCCGK